MKHDTEADVRTDTAIKVAALFFAAMMFLAFTTDPIRTGTQEGDRAPDLTGMAYNGNGWSNFEMSDYLTTNWTVGDVDGQWMAIEFMDTDCPYCVRSAGEIGKDASYFMKQIQSHSSHPGVGPWDGPIVNFFASATQLDIQGHETSRSEIEAFRDKSGEESCAGQSCANRDGSPHNFIYIDDIDQDNMKEWKVPGTPAYFLIQPDGIVAWVSTENTQETIFEAIMRLTPEV
jgi:hypothetical protein